jgi:hypothetical protein
MAARVKRAAVVASILSRRAKGSAQGASRAGHAVGDAGSAALAGSAWPSSPSRTGHPLLLAWHGINQRRAILEQIST